MEASAPKLISTIEELVYPSLTFELEQVLIFNVLHISFSESESVMHCFKCDVHASACTLCPFPGIDGKQ